MEYSFVRPHLRQELSSKGMGKQCTCTCQFTCLAPLFPHHHHQPAEHRAPPLSVSIRCPCGWLSVVALASTTKNRKRNHLVVATPIGFGVVRRGFRRSSPPLLIGRYPMNDDVDEPPERPVWSAGLRLANIKFNFGGA